MSIILGVDGKPFQAPPEPRQAVLAILLSGMKLLAGEQDGRWYAPMMLVPTQRGTMHMPLLEECLNKEWMDPVPESKALLVTREIDANTLRSYENAVSELSAARAGIVRAYGVPN